MGWICIVSLEASPESSMVPTEVIYGVQVGLEGNQISKLKWNVVKSRGVKQ